MIAYGLLGPYYNDDPNIFYNQAFTVVALALFVLMGFGMVLSYYKFGNWIGMTTAIVVVILNIQLSPLMQKFWFSVIISHFGKLNIPSLVGNNVAQFWLRYSAIGLQASF
jgi:ABC-type transport system involved in multi-copper enzyme maturation permease subunit